MAGWTDERVEKAKAMWAEGASTTQISTALSGGLTRNAVAGKLHRLGAFGQPRSGVERSAGRAPQPKGSTEAAQKPAVEGALSGKRAKLIITDELEPPPLPDSKPVTLLERRFDQCCWPLGDPRDFENFRYCGAYIDGPSSYCRFHDRLLYQAGTTIGRRDAREQEMARRRSEARAIMAGVA